MKLFAVGQEAVGVVAIGQAATGVLWAGGMLGVAATSGPGVVGGLFGRLYLRRLLGRQRGPAFPHDRFSRNRMLVAGALTAAIAGLWWVAAGQWLLDDLTRPAEGPGRSAGAAAPVCAAVLTAGAAPG